MKSVLVTGGTVRLGKAIAAHLRAAGWRVITSSHRADAGADIVADLSQPLGAAALYAATLRLLDGAPPDALVNNAALFTGEEARLTAVNLEAPRKLTMLMAGRETGVGAVVDILDARLLDGVGAAASTPYQRTKLELLRDVRKSALMFAATLRVNGVAPGPVFAPVGVHERAGETALAARPTAVDVAEAVLYLLNAPSVTGAVIPVDSGQHLLEGGE